MPWWIRAFIPTMRAARRNFWKVSRNIFDEAGIGTISEVFDARATPGRWLHRTGLECGRSLALLGKSVVRHSKVRRPAK
jgi:hypothetical protein